MKKIIIFSFILFFININVDAASLCSYQEQDEINNKVSNIKSSYEIMEEEIESELYYVRQYIDINITNITSDFYVIVKNDYNDDEITYTNEDVSNGILTISWENLDKVTNFTIEVYTTDKTSCPDEKYKTMYLTLPRYNEFSNRVVCLDNPEFYLCEEFVTFKEIKDTDFITQYNKYIDSNDNDEEKPSDNEKDNLIDKIIGFIDDYKFYIGGSILFIIVTSIVIYRLKTKKQRELGL